MHGVGDHSIFALMIENDTELIFGETVVNMTTGQNPGSSARPGDVLAWERPRWFPSRNTGRPRVEPTSTGRS